MKQYLLMLPMMCLTATTSMAQTSYDTALEAKMGENTFNVEGDDMQTIIWKYTAEKNSVIGVGPLPNTYTYPSVCGVVGKDTVNMNQLTSSTALTAILWKPVKPISSSYRDAEQPDS